VGGSRTARRGRRSAQAGADSRARGHHHRRAAGGGHGRLVTRWARTIHTRPYDYGV